MTLQQKFIEHNKCNSYDSKNEIEFFFVSSTAKRITLSTVNVINLFNYMFFSHFFAKLFNVLYSFKDKQTLKFVQTLNILCQLCMCIFTVLN